MNSHISESKVPYSNLRVLFFDEASFGRLSTPSDCWAPIGIRPTVPSHKLRQFIYAYGAVSPEDGECFFITAPKCNTQGMNLFLNLLSERYPKDYLLLIGDNASWHKAQALNIPENIQISYIPPYTPEMNPIEQIWKEIRTNGGVKNKLFSSLEKVVDQLEKAIKKLTKDTVKSITNRDWIPSYISNGK